MKPIRLEVNPETTMSDITHFLTQINLEDDSIATQLTLYADYSCRVSIPSQGRSIINNWEEGYIEYTPESTD